MFRNRKKNLSNLHCYVTFQWTTFLSMSLLNVLSIRCSYHSVKTYINFSLTSIRVLCQVNDHKNTCYCFLWFIHQNVSRISLLYQILWSLAYPYPIIIHVTTTRITFVLVNLQGPRRGRGWGGASAPPPPPPHTLFWKLYRVTEKKVLSAPPPHFESLASPPPPPPPLSK